MPREKIKNRWFSDETLYQPSKLDLGLAPLLTKLVLGNQSLSTKIYDLLLELEIDLRAIDESPTKSNVIAATKLVLKLCNDSASDESNKNLLVALKELDQKSLQLISGQLSLLNCKNFNYRRITKENLPDRDLLRKAAKSVRIAQSNKIGRPTASRVINFASDVAYQLEKHGMKASLSDSSKHEVTKERRGHRGGYLLDRILRECFASLGVIPKNKKADLTRITTPAVRRARKLLKSNAKPGVLISPIRN